jgi:nitrite reductase/ring-hydroxylating ferredoxin subunit/uncharacterized membrane protein
MFPFASLWLAFGFDVAGVVTARSSWWTTGAYLAAVGIAAAVVAAIPGFIDYIGTVPPRSTAKGRATKHMVVNLSAVTLFVVAFLLRREAAAQPDTLVLALEGVAVALLSVGGWMGGTLVSRNQIGVDHRYAGAGVWREERVSPPAGEPVAIAASGELEINQMKLLTLGDRRIVLGRTADGYVAFDDRCTHRGGSLAAGVMICGTVQCPWHGSQFDVSNGAVQAGPAGRKIGTYDVAVRDGHIVLLQL